MSAGSYNYNYIFKYIIIGGEHALTPRRAPQLDAHPTSLELCARGPLGVVLLTCGKLRSVCAASHGMTRGVLGIQSFSCYSPHVLLSLAPVCTLVVCVCNL